METAPLLRVSHKQPDNNTLLPETSIIMNVLNITTLFRNIEASGETICQIPPSPVTIGLMDCGVQADIPDLREARLAIRNFTTSSRLDSNLLSHGTYSTSLLVAQGHKLLTGLVPKARLLLAQVVGSYGHADENPILKALQWFQAEKVDVIAIPLGALQTNQPVSELLQSLTASNILIFAASGNLHPSPTLFPARHADVVAVGATDRYGNILTDCCCDPEPDVLIPGEHIPGLISGDVIGIRSGTSVACVLAAGMAALSLSQQPCPRDKPDKQSILDLLGRVCMAD